MIDGKICTRSINAISYMCYCNSQPVEIVENESGLRMYSVEDTEYNREIYNKYKTAMATSEDKIQIDLVKFTKILRYLKQLSRNYKRED